MPRYYINIVRKEDGLIRKRIINHCDIDKFGDTLEERGFAIKQINEVADDVNLEDIETLDINVQNPPDWDGSVTDLIGE
jgi:hypothetical protein